VGREEKSLGTYAVDDIMKGDPNEDVIKDLMNQFSSYKEAIDIIDHVLNHKK
jgi:hypothetical protein